MDKKKIGALVAVVVAILGALAAFNLKLFPGQEKLAPIVEAVGTVTVPAAPAPAADAGAAPVEPATPPPTP